MKFCNIRTPGCAPCPRLINIRVIALLGGFLFVLVISRHYSKEPQTVDRKLIITDRMRMLSEDGKIFISTIDINYIPLVLNLYWTSYAPFNITNYLFVATDNKSCSALARFGINCFHYLSLKNSNRPSVFNSFEFKRKTYVRPQLVLEGLRVGLTVILLDLDIVFLRSPLSYLHCSDCDILYQQETRPMDMNGGLYVVRPTKAGITLQERSLARMSPTRPSAGDQIYINAVLANMRARHMIKAVPLDPEQFPNGHRFFERGHRMFKGDNPCQKCVLIHNNYVVSLEAKRYRFKELGLWKVDADGYYSNPERKYLKFDNPVDFGKKNTMEMELKSLLNAFLIGRVLNRTVILPRFHCYGVRRYNPKVGQLCYFAAHYSVRELEKFTTNYRENVFLESQLVPESVKLSVSANYVLDSVVWKEYGDKTSDPYVLSTNGSDLSVNQIKEWFASIKASVLIFHSLYNSIISLDKDTSRYMRRLNEAIRRSNFRQI